VFWRLGLFWGFSALHALGSRRAGGVSYSLDFIVVGLLIREAMVLFLLGG
jgi:hypothetical protein